MVGSNLFKTRVFSTANLAAFIAFGATGIQLLSISLFLQQSWDWGPIVSLHHSHSYVAAIVPSWVILGTGLGLSYPTIVEAATGDLQPAATGAGSAVNAVARQLGEVFGTAILAVILGQAAVTGHVAKY